MNDSLTKPSAVFWIVAGLSLLWNGFGGYDYTMTMSHNTAYLGQMGNAQDIIGWVESFPLWATTAYALGIWGSVAGSILLLLRSRHAVTAFLVSLLGAIVSFAAQKFVVPAPASLDTAVNRIMPVVVLGLILLQWWWAKRQVANGTLK